ncbi:MAG: CatB-related O-acetyltransferase [Azospirillaceae bacterium]|nr:CatB-related O-acetyltransferase [Azospirillaceae bacterium]
MANPYPQLEKFGLRCEGLSLNPDCIVTIEPPVNLSQGQFTGRCSVGYGSYLIHGFDVTDCDIGRFCSIGRSLVVGPSQHWTDYFSTHPFISPQDRASGLGGHPLYDPIRPPIGMEYRIPSSRAGRNRRTHIGNDVWIGRQCIIMGGVSIGDGAVVGAASVVTHDVAPYEIVAGNPARPIRYRFAPPLIEKMLRIRWWDYDVSLASQHVDYSDTEATADFFEQAIAEQLLPRLTPRNIVLSAREDGLIDFKVT